ncbi:MAG: ParA family protein, partial [Bacteroidota bacterium]
DMDPQANLTQAMGFIDEPEPNLYEAFKQESAGEAFPLSDIIRQANGVDLLSSSLELSSAELELVSAFGREQMLKRMLARLGKTYDIAIIDCPPSMGMLTVNALTASHYVLMPMQAEYLPLKGLVSFLRSLKLVQAQLNPDLQVLGILLTKYDPRRNMTQNILDLLTSSYGEILLETRIRTNITLAKAQEAGKDIFTFDKSSKGAEDYGRLRNEILTRLPV